MSLLRVGSTEKYSANWSKAFGEKPSGPKSSRQAKAAKSSNRLAGKAKTAGSKSKKKGKR
ncbi:MAG: hypothetical protein ACK56D_13560 [Planctomycetota bacterium]|jgi:hypothetical protein